MDMAAAAVAMKFSKGNCVTARVDELLFHLPIFVGALVTCTASLVYVGRTSMEVLVRVESEDLESHSGPEKALSANFTMVCMGKNGRPQAIGREYVPETELEKKLWKEAEERRESSSRERQRKKLHQPVNRSAIGLATFVTARLLATAKLSNYSLRAFYFLYSST